MNDHALAYLGKERGPIRTPVIFKQGTITASQGAAVAPFSAAAGAVALAADWEIFFPVRKEAVCSSVRTVKFQARLSKKNPIISVFYRGNYYPLLPPPAYV